MLIPLERPSRAVLAVQRCGERFRGGGKDKSLYIGETEGFC